jgi:hypothetical protein
MKSIAILLLIILRFQFELIAQNDVPNDIPLKGKILSYEIVRVFGDSLSGFLIEKATYDKKGRILEIKKGGENKWGWTSVIKHIYEPGKEFIYKCECKDIEPFVKEFVIRDRNELKNQPVMELRWQGSDTKLLVFCFPLYGYFFFTNFCHQMHKS